MTDDLLQLAQQHEALNKKFNALEVEFKCLSERHHKSAEELDQKSKILQQYILRDYSEKIQPDPVKPHAFNINILSNIGAMQKMDPVQLSQINIKLQKLVEELTIKMMAMDGLIK